MAHLVGGATHAALDHRIGILCARVQPTLEIGRGRRQNEYADDVVARFFAQLLRTLPIDVEQHVLSS